MSSKPFLLPILSLGLLGAACDTNAGRWRHTCGDPVCRGYQPPAGVRRCTSERPGDSCPVLDERCDPMDDCNRLLFCSQEPPAPVPCPISVRSAKRDIRYLTAEDLERYARELRSVRLATYRYRDDPPDATVRLGFIIDDRPPAASVDGTGERVDLYGYTSLAVAALQAQAREIEELRREVAALRQAAAPPHPHSLRSETSASRTGSAR